MAKKRNRKKMTYKDIPYDYKIDYESYRDGEKSVAEIASYNHVSCETIYKYFRMITEHNADPPLNNKRGRKPKDDSWFIVLCYKKDYERWKKGELTITRIARLHSKSRTTIYKYFHLLKSLEVDN